MAALTIAQMFDDVKQKNPESIIPSSILLRGNSTVADEILPLVIISGETSQAREVLNLVGGATFIPHTDYTTLEEIAGFYGVSTEYMCGLFKRNGMTLGTMLNDVRRYRRAEVEGVLRKFPDVCISVERTDLWGEYYTIAQKNSSGCSKISIPVKGLRCFYSSRVFLAAAGIMYYGSRIPKNNKASHVMEVLRRSSYYKQAEEIARQNEARHKKQKEQRQAQITESAAKEAPASAPVQPAAAGIPITESGQLLMSPEALMDVVKVAVKETVLALVPVIREGLDPASPPPPCQAGRRSCAKLTKPDNWDDVVSRWKRGEITARAAAKETGMSDNSFGKYAKGLKTFH